MEHKHHEHLTLEMTVQVFSEMSTYTAGSLQESQEHLWNVQAALKAGGELSPEDRALFDAVTAFDKAMTDKQVPIIRILVALSNYVAQQAAGQCGHTAAILSLAMPTGCKNCEKSYRMAALTAFSVSFEAGLRNMITNTENGETHFNDSYNAARAIPEVVNHVPDTGYTLAS
jgi:hypothetical protein